MRRALIVAHRWLGVALSGVFLLWFLSGIVMMYWSFPEVTPQDRLQRLPVLDPLRVRISGAEAHAAIGAAHSASQIRLTTIDGRPVYRLEGLDGSGSRDRSPRAAPAAVYADDGTPLRLVDAGMIDRAAARWAGLPVEDAVKEPVDEVDQWTVGALRNVRPLFKYSWPGGQQVYVNGRSGEVAQYTTTSSRVWAYLGAIPHWFYFTPLRKHQQAWTSFVVWSSSIGTVTALLGVAVILLMYSPRKRYRRDGRPTSIPYAGWKRWHAVAGLVFGVVTVTWAFSGLLSMGPFAFMNRLGQLAVPRAAQRPSMPTSEGINLDDALRGAGSLSADAFEARHPREAIALLDGFGVKELEYAMFDGEPVYLARDGRGGSRIVPVIGEPAASFNHDAIMRIVRRAAGSAVAELRVITEYDAYYLDRRRARPLPVVYARLNDAGGTRYYIDPRTGRVVGTYNSRNWVSRWLYHGLHSLDFPWLYRYRPLWDIVVITLLLGGAALSATSIVLAWGVISRALR